MINGVEIAIIDTPKNRPVLVEVKPKTGISGKANIRVFEVNNKGGGTIMITKISGTRFEFAKELAFNVIRYMLDEMISGGMKPEDVKHLRKKKPVDTITPESSSVLVQCEVCEKRFVNMQGMRLHLTRMHKNVQIEDKLKFSNEMLLDEKDEKNDAQFPDVIEETCVPVEDKIRLEEDIYKHLEAECWEEKRFLYVKDGKENKDDDKMDLDDELINQAKQKKSYINSRK